MFVLSALTWLQTANVCCKLILVYLSRYDTAVVDYWVTTMLRLCWATVVDSLDYFSARRRPSEAHSLGSVGCWSMSGSPDTMSLCSLQDSLSSRRHSRIHRWPLVCCYSDPECSSIRRCLQLSQLCWHLRHSTLCNSLLHNKSTYLSTTIRFIWSKIIAS